MQQFAETSSGIREIAAVLRHSGSLPRRASGQIGIAAEPMNSPKCDDRIPRPPTTL